jgi:hypothetical protein
MPQTRHLRQEGEEEKNLQQRLWYEQIKLKDVQVDRHGRSKMQGRLSIVSNEHWGNKWCIECLAHRLENRVGQEKSLARSRRAAKLERGRVQNKR